MTPNEAQAREAFEKAMHDVLGYRQPFPMMSPDIYQEHNVQKFWRIWQAGRNSLSEVIEEMAGALEFYAKDGGWSNSADMGSKAQQALAKAALVRGKSRTEAKSEVVDNKRDPNFFPGLNYMAEAIEMGEKHIGKEGVEE